MGCCHGKDVVYTEITDRCTAPGVVFHEEIQTVNGSKRNVASWIPENMSIRGAVIMSHGLNEHILRYYGVAIALAKDGFAVYGIDHVSHGKSDGRRGVIPDYQIMCADFIAFGNSIRDLHPDVPLYLLAHSMGTLVGMMSINSIKGLSAAFLSGPAIFSGPASSSPFGIRCLYPLTQTSFAVWFTSVTSSVDPGGAAAPLVSEQLTSDVEEVKVNQHDPRVAPAVVTNKSAYEVVKMITAVKQQIPNIRIPIMVIHGAEDLIILPSSAEYVYKNVGTEITHRKLVIIPKARHEPFHEVQEIRTEAIQMVVDFFNHQAANPYTPPDKDEKVVESTQLEIELSNTSGEGGEDPKAAV